MVVTYKVTRRGIVILRTTHPGVVVGKRGVTIGNITKELKERANAKGVKLYELTDYSIPCEVKCTRNEGIIMIVYEK